MCIHSSSLWEQMFRAWQIPGVEVHAAPEGSVPVLKGNLSAHEFCCAFLDVRQMAILHMQLALACLELSYSVTPVYHCSSTQQFLPLFALSLSVNHKASVAVAKPGAGLA